MMEENTVEMCVFDIAIPKYYKGHDMDVLLQKMINRKPLTKTERTVIRDAQKEFYGQQFEENQACWDEYKRTHPGMYIKYTDPQRTDKQV